MKKLESVPINKTIKKVKLLKTKKKVEEPLNYEDKISTKRSKTLRKLNYSSAIKTLKKLESLKTNNTVKKLKQSSIKYKTLKKLKS